MGAHPVPRARGFPRGPLTARQSTGFSMKLGWRNRGAERGDLTDEDKARPADFMEYG